MSTTWAFIYVAPDTDPVADRVVLDRGGFRNMLVPVPDPSQSPQVAIDLVDEGAQLIEICGVHGPVWIAKVIEAVGDRVPVGGVTFGAESVEALARFKAAAAAV
jgi:Family of unknown function (DUF6506)